MAGDTKTCTVGLMLAKARVEVALALCFIQLAEHPASSYPVQDRRHRSWENDDVCLRKHVFGTVSGENIPFFFFLDVRPVMLDATSDIARAKDGAPCKSLGHVQKRHF